MLLKDVLAAIQTEPGARLRSLRASFGIPSPDQDEARTLAHLVQQLEELGLIHQDAGGWYEAGESRDTVRAARRQAAQDARLASRQEKDAIRAAMRGKRLAAIQSRTAQQSAAITAEHADRAQRVAEFARLSEGLTLQKIADLAGRTHGAAQAWREGRVFPPQYAIDALRAFRGEALSTQCFTGKDSESVTDLI